jgi:hypothetical protein
MTGIEDFNYPAFNTAETALLERGILCLNPASNEAKNTTGKPQEWDWYMRHALRMVTLSDGICLLPGWESSKGAQLEVKVAEALQLDIRPYDEWLKVKP